MIGKPSTAKRKLQQFGPAIIVAAVVCGPGSILTASKTGAQFEYGAVWVLVVACVLMLGMVTLATRIGLAYERTPCAELSVQLGRPVAIAVGVVMFLIVSCFQSSNNIAVVAAFETFGIAAGKPFSIISLLAINAVVVFFLYQSRQLYGVVEWAMKALVLLMVLAFLFNFLLARPSPQGIVAGLWPGLPPMENPRTEIWILVALVGTTFSVAAAFYQAYLVREKGWTAAQIPTAFTDSVIGVATLAGITLIIMATSASVFFGRQAGEALSSPQDIARQLEPLFGIWSQFIFGIGIFAGAISSFLVNAMIGGHILADGCGLGDKLSSRWTQHFTTLALLVGMTVALLTISTGMSRVQLIIFAQALTVVGVPALALALLHLGIGKRMQDKQAIPLWVLLLAVAGFAVTFLLAGRTVLNIVETLNKS